MPGNPDGRLKLEDFLDHLLATQSEAGLNILALPEGDQVEELQTLRVARFAETAC